MDVLRAFVTFSLTFPFLIPTAVVRLSGLVRPLRGLPPRRAGCQS